MNYPCTSSKDNDPIVMSKGAEWYEVIQKKARLEPRYNGYYLVINTETGEYLLGTDSTESLARAKSEIGDKNFYIHLCNFF